MPEQDHPDEQQGTPRWVKLCGLAALLVFIAFAAIHIAGGGFRNHMSHLP